LIAFPSRPKSQIFQVPWIPTIARLVSAYTSRNRFHFVVRLSCGNRSA